MRLLFVSFIVGRSGSNPRQFVFRVRLDSTLLHHPHRELTHLSFFSSHPYQVLLLLLSPDCRSRALAGRSLAESPFSFFFVLFSLLAALPGTDRTEQSDSNPSNPSSSSSTPLHSTLPLQSSRETGSESAERLTEQLAYDPVEEQVGLAAAAAAAAVRRPVACAALGKGRFHIRKRGRKKKRRETEIERDSGWPSR